MKRMAALVLAFSLLLCACGNEKDNVSHENVVGAQNENILPEPSAAELAQLIILDSGRELDTVQLVNDSYDAEAMVGYVQGYYGLAESEWSECAIYRAQAADDAFEISVFKLSSLAEPNIVLQSLEEYRLDRQGDFFGYNPEQESLVDKASVCISNDGSWAAILICDNPARAYDAFVERLGMTQSEDDADAIDVFAPISEPLYPSEHDATTMIDLDNLPDYWLPYIDPEIDDMTLWDNTALVSALKSGDDSALDKEGKKLYKAVSKVLAEIISDEMSTFEKEEAVYRWLTENCRYDHRHYEIPNNAPRESYEPYGAIINGKAVCLGYATAFQLFMDVLDIECITVVGGAFESREDHAWNMVKIDGEWYCCDPTWDEGAYGFGHFNKSSDYFAMTGHQWDYEAYPIAVSDNDGNWADEIWVTVDPAA